MNIGLMEQDSVMGDTEVLVQRAPQRDMVEETIRDRVRAADEEKRRVLAAFDAAAKSGIQKLLILRTFRNTMVSVA